MKKIIFLFAIILFFTPLKIVFSQYGGFNDSPFKEGALVTAVSYTHLTLPTIRTV